MDEADIESWYDEEKEKALEKYMKDIDEKKNRKEAEKKYKEKTKKLRKKYARLYEKSRKPSFVKKCLDKIKEYMNKLVDIYRE